MTLEINKLPTLFRTVRVFIPDFFKNYEIGTIIHFRCDGIRNYYLIKRRTELQEQYNWAQESYLIVEPGLQYHYKIEL
jgi:hypothetical protein